MTALKTTPQATIQQIQTLLAEGYGSGFTIFKELVQNADDVRATRLLLAGHAGFAGADNVLLRAPGIFVANNGPVSTDNWEALQLAAGGGKGGESQSVGRFGLGQKALYHLCDAYAVYAKRDGGAEPSAMILNPYEDIGEADHARAWKTLSTRDHELLAEWADSVGMGGGLVLRIPLRTADLRPSSDARICLTRTHWTPRDALKNILDGAQLHAAIACLRHLNCIDIECPGENAWRAELRPGFTRLAGPGEEAQAMMRPTFGGRFAINGQDAEVYGAQSNAANGKAIALRSLGDWPAAWTLTGLEKAKATPHGAAIICRHPTNKGQTARLRIWHGVYLPLGDPAKDRAVLSEVELGSSHNIDLVVHGDFFVSSNRASILVDDGNKGQDAVKTLWNEALLVEAALPCVLDAVASTVESLLESPQRYEVVRALGGTGWWRTNASAICKGRALVRRLDSRGDSWSIEQASSIRPVPLSEHTRPRRLVEAWKGFEQWCAEFGFVLAVGATLGENLPAWSGDELAELITGMAPAAVASKDAAQTLAAILGENQNDRGELQAGALMALEESFRTAIAAKAKMAPSAQIKLLTRFLAPNRILVVPRSVVDPDLLAHLATHSTVLCIRSDWLSDDDSSGARKLSQLEAAELFAALEPMAALKGRISDQAQTLLAYVLERGPSLEDLARDQSTACLDIIPTIRVNDRATVLLSPAKLLELMREKTMFDRGPVQNLEKLAAAVRNPEIYQLRANISIVAPRGFEFASSNRAADKIAVLGKAERLGALPARVALFGELREHLPPLALRRLISGEPGLREADQLARIIQLPDALMGLVSKLSQNDSHIHMLDSAIASKLSQEEARKASVVDLDLSWLGDQLMRRREFVEALDETQAMALLASELPVEALAPLALHRVMLENGLHRPDALLRGKLNEVPPAMRELVRIVDPWPDQKAAKRQRELIPDWTEERQIALALGSTEPRHFEAEILSALGSLASVDEALKTELRKRPWLTVKGRAVAPEALQDLLPCAADAWEPLLPGSPPILRVELSADVSAVLDRHGLIDDRAGSYRNLLCTMASSGVSGLIVDLVQGQADFSRIAIAKCNLDEPAWPMLASVLRAFETEEALRRVLSGIDLAVPDDDAAIDQLNSLANLAGQDGQVGEAARRLWRMGFEVRSTELRSTTRFLPADLLVESEAGDFVRAEQLALVTSGVEASDSLAARWHFDLPADYEPAVAESRLASMPIGEKAAALFAPFRPFHELHGAVLLVLAMLGRDTAIRRVASQFPGSPGFDDVCADLDNASRRTLGLCDPLPAHMDHLRLSVVSVSDDRALVLSAAGTAMLARARKEGALLYGCVKVDGAPHSWQLSMSAIEPRDLQHATDLLRDAVTKLVAPIGMRMPNQSSAVLSQFDSYLKSDQATLDELVRDIKDGLAERIKKLTRGDFLKGALTRYDADRKQGRHEDDDAAARQRAKDKLWEAITQPEAAKELLSAIREKMHNRNYAAERALFELFQNAVDAAHQKGEQSDVRIEVARDQTGAIRCIRFIHWGRPINVPGGPNTPARFERDLDNMLDLDSSEKEGQDRGKHGLGFKTCHMLSDDTRVASGRLLFRIRGGMIPVGWEEGRALQQVHNNRDAQATIVEMPITRGREGEAGRAWDEFSKVAEFLPVVAPDISEIVLVDGTEIRIGKARARHVTKTISLVEYGRGQRALRLNLDANHRMYVKLLEGMPTHFAKSWNRLWNLAPLDGEELNVAWLIDGKLEMDQGRRGLHGQHADKLKVMARLGGSLGQQLVQLFDDWTMIAPIADLTTDGRDVFFARLIDLMIGDTNDPLARELHGMGDAEGGGGEQRGLAALVSQCAVVPLAAGGFVRAGDVQGVYSHTLSDPAVREKVEYWTSRLGDGANMIEARSAGRIMSLGFARPREVDLGTLAEDLCWNAEVDAGQAQTLGSVFNSKERDSWFPEERRRADAAFRTVQLRSEAGQFAPANRLWFPQDLREGYEGKIERLRAAFMPPEARLHPDYAGAALDFVQLARARAGYTATVEREHLKSAYLDPARCLAALIYLAENPAQISGLNWLTDVVALRALPSYAQLTRQQRGTLEAWLVTDEPWWDDMEDPDAETDRSPEDILRDVAAWWAENRASLAARHDELTYGELGELCSAANLQAGDDAAWFTILSLGSFQTLGRITPQQSRGFVQRGVTEGWWHDLASIGGTDRELRPYVERLLAWSDIGATEDFLTWRRCLGDMCLIARNLDAYRTILTALPQMIDQTEGTLAMSQLLRPSGSHIVGRMSIDAAPLAKSLGMGANWIVRELARRGFYERDEAELVQPFAWSARLRIRNFLRHIRLDDFVSGVDQGVKIHRALCDKLGEDHPFGIDGDLPLELLNTRERAGGWRPERIRILNGTWSEEEAGEEDIYA